MEEKVEECLSWKYLPLKLELQHITKTFIDAIMPVIKPSWSTEHLQTLHCCQDLGVSNDLLVCFYQEGSNKEEPGNVVVLRVNGGHTHLFIDREQEAITLQVAHKLTGLNPPLYLQLTNGLCYGYVPGRPLDGSDITNEHIMRGTASAIAQFHTLMKLPSRFHGDSSIIPSTYKKYYHLIPSRFHDDETNEKVFATFESKESLKREMKEMVRVMNTFKSPLAYCHNDLQYGNIIYNKRTGDCTLIDHEYGGVNYTCCDLGDFFGEMPGLNMPDYSKYPNEVTQKWFIRMYLEERNKHKGKNKINENKNECAIPCYNVLACMYIYM